MNNVTDRIAYLRGLADGMKLDASKDENQLLLEALKVLEELAQHLKETKVKADTLNDYAEELDDCLSELEDTFFEEDECECDCQSDVPQHSLSSMEDDAPICGKQLLNKALEGGSPDLPEDIAEEKKGRKTDKKKKKNKHKD